MPCIKISFILIILCSSLLILDAQEIDTLVIISEVSELKTISSKRKYLERIIDEDQKYRGNITNDSLDFRHLVSLSYYVNEHGYPTKKEVGEYATGLWLIYRHSKWNVLQKIAFPIILKGYLAGVIDPKSFRLDYLKRFYKHDDENYRTLPLKELIAMCEVNTDKISVNELIKAETELGELDSMEIASASYWKADGISKTYDYEGEKITVDHEGQLIRIFEKVNGKTYLEQLVYIEYESGFDEIVKWKENKFKEKDKIIDNYYEVLADKVLYRNKDEILKTFNKTDQRHGTNDHHLGRRKSK